MATSYPGSLDNFTNPTSTSPINSPSHADQHSNANDAIEALEAKVGSNNSVVTTSHDYKIAQLESLVTSSVAGAKSIYQDVRNQSGSAFTKATPVYVSGSEGASGKMLISAASNASEATSSKTMGITTSAISNNSNGQVISEGILEGIDTTGAADGDPVWLGVNGAKIYGLANKPSAPAHLVFLGIVIRGGQANTGSMYVKIQNGFELQEIHNVELSSLVNGNILAYDSTTQTWKNTNTLQSTSSTTPLVVKGTSSPSANIFEVQNSSGYPMVFVDAYGALKAQASGMYVNSGYASGTGLVVRGYTSQTADLQQWQDSSGTALTRIKSNGNLIINADGFSAVENTTSAVKINSNTAQNANEEVLLRFHRSGVGSTTYGGGVDFKVSQWQSTSAGTGYVPYTQLTIALKSGATDNESANINVLTLRDNSTIGINNTTPSAQLDINIGSSSRKGLIVKADASQTANLQEWQNSSGTVLTKINSNGALSLSNATLVTSESSNVGDKIGLYSNVFGFGIDYGRTVAFVSAVGDAFAVRVAASSGTASFGSDAVALFGNGSVVQTLSSASTVGLIIKGAASQTANLFETQDSSGNALVSLLATANSTNTLRFTDNFAFGINWGSRKILSTEGGSLIVTPYTTDRKVLIVKGVASQTANLQEWQTSTGTVLGKLDKDGVLTTIDLVSGSLNATWRVYSTAGASTVVPITAKGAASQTANLTEWLDSSGNLLAFMSSNGRMAVDHLNASVLLNNYIVNNGDNGPYFNMTSTNTLLSNRNTVSNVIFTIKGMSGQTGNLQEWQDSSGTILTRVTSSGVLGTSAGVYSPYYQGHNGVGGAIAFANATAITITPQSASVASLIVKGLASQTADLQQWQDSTGTVAASINSGGSLSLSRSLYTSASLGVWASVNADPQGGSTGNALTVQTYNTTSKGIVIAGQASQTANLQEWQDSAGTVLASIAKNGDLTNNGIFTVYGRFGGASFTDAVALRVNGYNTSVPTAVIKGLASQTANLQEWQNSSGTTLAYMSTNGHLVAQRVYAPDSLYVVANGGPGTVNIETYSFAAVGIIVKGKTSQTGDLQQWQNSSGTVLAKVDASGSLELNGKDIELMNIMGAF